MSDTFNSVCRFCEEDADCIADENGKAQCANCSEFERLNYIKKIVYGYGMLPEYATEMRQDFKDLEARVHPKVSKSLRPHTGKTS